MWSDVMYIVYTITTTRRRVNREKRKQGPIAGVAWVFFVHLSREKRLLVQRDGGGLCNAIRLLETPRAYGENRRRRLRFTRNYIIIYYVTYTRIPNRRLFIGIPRYIGITRGYLRGLVWIFRVNTRNALPRSSTCILYTRCAYNRAQGEYREDAFLPPPSPTGRH